MSLLQSINFTGVDFANLQANPQPIQISNFVNFSNIACNQEMRNFVGPTANFIYNYVASKATTNIARMVHFNMLVSNNFSNPELAIMTTFAINLAYIKLKTGVFTNIENALQNTSTWVVDRRINYIIINSDKLSMALQENIGQIRSTATEYVSEVGNVENLLANTYSNGPVNAGFNNNHPNQGGMTGFGGGGFNGNQSNFNGNQGGFGGQQQFNQQGQNFTGFSTGQNVIGGFGGAAQVNDNRDLSSVITRVNTSGQPTQRENRFTKDLIPPTIIRKQEPVQQSEVKQEKVQTAEVTQASVEKPVFNKDGSINMENLEETELPWKTSTYQRFAIAYDKSRFNIVNKLIPGKTEKENVVISFLKKVNPMDRAAHSLPVSEQFLNQVHVPKIGTTVVTNREEFKDASLNRASSVLKEIREIDSEANYMMRLDKLRSLGHIVLNDPVYSIEEAISYARLAATSYMDGEIGAYQLEFNLVKEIAVKSSDVSEITKLTNFKTIESLATKIRGVIEDQHATFSLRTAMVQLNAYLAVKFLEYIKFYLCISEYKASDSFIEDAVALIDDIEKKYGKSYKELLISSQEKFINTTLNFGDVLQTALEDRANFLADDPTTKEIEGVSLINLVTPCMMTCTEFLDSEYSLELPDEIGAVFSEQATSESLFKLVKESVTNPYSAGFQTVIKRFFIVTLDDKVYETNAGLNKTLSPLLIKKLN